LNTIAQAHQALVDGTISSRELVDHHLRVIERRNPEINAFITVAADRARAVAARCDAERAAGVNCGPLHGIPISIKDIIDQAGVVTTAASHVLDDRVAPADALVVSRLEEAGAVIIGRANLHQFALGTTSDDSAYGPVRNPRDTSRVAGGSSGGSAAAVAAGMGLGSVGTDTGASVRVPAAVCGVVGLKPTFGEVPTSGVLPLSTTLDHVGPLANTVQDAAWMWQIMSGRSPAAVTLSSPATLRLGALGGYFDELLDSNVRAAKDGAHSALRAAGVAISSVQLAETAHLMSAYANIVLAEGAAWHAPYLDTKKDGYSPTVHNRLAVLGRAVPATAYLDALALCQRLREAVDALLDNADALMLPTLPIEAPTLGQADIVVEPRFPEPMPIRTVMLRLTQAFNMTGHPAISLPIPTSGLPVGLQIVGRRRETGALLGIAALVERILSNRTSQGA
jgi:aspartyl-tRNA(Asn)/glutamyl-tRNA(Gln) amidotransferase subunit A